MTFCLDIKFGFIPVGTFLVKYSNFQYAGYIFLHCLVKNENKPVVDGAVVEPRGKIKMDILSNISGVQKVRYK